MVMDSEGIAVRSLSCTAMIVMAMPVMQICRRQKELRWEGESLIEAMKDNLTVKKAWKEGTESKTGKQRKCQNRQER